MGRAAQKASKQFPLKKVRRTDYEFVEEQQNDVTVYACKATHVDEPETVQINDEINQLLDNAA